MSVENPIFPINPLRTDKRIAEIILTTGWALRPCGYYRYVAGSGVVPERKILW